MTFIPIVYTKYMVRCKVEKLPQEISAFITLDCAPENEGCYGQPECCNGKAGCYKRQGRSFDRVYRHRARDQGGNHGHEEYFHAAREDRSRIESWAQKYLEELSGDDLSVMDEECDQ